MIMDALRNASGTFQGSVEPILGPPGTGKTTALLKRFEAEVQAGVLATSIAVVTFTRAGAREFLSRAESKFNLGRFDLPWVRTIHSAAFKLLDKPKLVTAAARRQFREAYGYDLSDENEVDMEDAPLEPPRRTPDDLLRHAYDWGRARLLDVDHTLARYPVCIPAPALHRFADRWAHFKQDKCMVDFTDLLERVLELHLRPEVMVAIVDEAQDLSPLQIAVVQMWFENCARVYVAGDDDQAIYQFQGASPDWLLKLSDLYEPTVLSQSYRVPVAAHAIAGRIISRNRTRIPKTYHPTPAAGVVDYLPAEQAVDELTATTDALVLVRNRFLLARLANRLMMRSIPYVVEGGGAANPLGREPVVYAARQAQQLAHGEDLHSVHLHALLQQVPTRGAGLLPHGVKAKVERLDRRISLAEMRNELGLGTLLDSIIRDGPCSVLLKLDATHRAFLGELLAKYGDIPEPTIRLTTIHGSKGREADTVLVMPDMATASYTEYCDGVRGGNEAENRVAYVGVTRCKRRLVLVRPSTRRFYSYPLTGKSPDEVAA